MFCNAPIPQNSICRAPIELVPEQATTQQPACADLDQKVTHGLNQLVSLKQTVTSIESELEAILSHIGAATAERGARHAVMQVTASNVVEQMERLYKHLTGSNCFTEPLNHVAAEMESIVKADDHRIEAPRGLVHQTVPVCLAQWAVIDEACRRLIDELLPTAVATVAEEPLGRDLRCDIGTFSEPVVRFMKSNLRRLKPVMQRHTVEGTQTIERLAVAAVQLAGTSPISEDVFHDCCDDTPTSTIDENDEHENDVGQICHLESLVALRSPAGVWSSKSAATYDSGIA